MDIRLKRYRDLLRGREDVYPFSPVGKGFFPAKTDGDEYAPLTDEVILRHLEGKEMIGVYPVLPDDTCYFIAVDFDNHTGTGSPEEDVRQYYALCEEAALPCYIERSRGGKGYHAWFFFTDKVEAWKAICVVTAILNALPDANREPFETFPKQPSVKGRGQELGNLIALPLHGGKLKEDNTAFLDPATLEPYADQWELLESIETIAPGAIDAIVKEQNLDQPIQHHYDDSYEITTGQAGLKKVLGCEFIEYCDRERTTLPEPLWRAMISNLCFFEGGTKEIHRLSEGYPTYSQEETDAKIKQAIGFGKPLTCKYIKEHGFACTYDCGVKSPAGLKGSHAPKIEVIQPLSAQRDETIAFMQLIASKGMLGLPTGYPLLDEVSRGLKYICILGAPYGYGKSTFCLNIAKNLALKEGIPTLILDRENRRDLSCMKLLCMTEGIPWNGGNVYQTIFEDHANEIICNRGKMNWDKYEDWNRTLQYIYFPAINGFDANLMERHIDQIREQHQREEILVVCDSLQKLPNIASGLERRTQIDIVLDNTRNIQQRTKATFLLISNYPKNITSGRGIELFKESGEIGGTARQALALDDKTDHSYIDGRGDLRKGYRMDLYIIKDNLSAAQNNDEPASTFDLKNPYWLFEEAGEEDTADLSDEDLNEEFNQGGDVAKAAKKPDPDGRTFH